MAENERVKKRYAPPRLTVYGPIAKLTKGGSGTRPDGGNGGHNHGRGRGG